MMRNARFTSVAVGAVLALSACASPEVQDLATMHEEDGIATLQYDPEALDALVLPDGVSADRFELGEFAFGRSFDRVGLRWDARSAGGSVAIEVQADGQGAWIPVTVTHEEFVPEAGRTFAAGYAEVPAGTTALRGRLLLGRVPDALDAASPQLAGLQLQVFSLAEVAEQGDGLPVDASEGGDLGLPEGASGFAAPAVVTRATWGARAPKCNGATHSPYRMTFHHTVTSNGESGSAARARMRQMQAYHQDALDWCDIGYHFSVDAAGSIYRGRTTSARTGSHVGGQNSGNIGISLMGTFTTVSPSTAQLSGLMDAFAWLAEEWSIPATSDRIRGHRQWPGQSTSCPGDKTLAQKTTILSGVTARLAGTQTPPPPPSAPTVVVDNPSTGFAASSSWWASTSQPDRYGNDYRVRAAAATSDMAEWKATLETREYEVFVWYSQGANRVSAAPYLVFHKNGTTKKHVDQRTNGGRWVSLGTYPFAAGNASRVGLSCWTSSGQYVIADAVKFVPK